MTEQDEIYAVQNLITALQGFSKEDRLRLLRTALAFTGEEITARATVAAEPVGTSFGAKANSWMKRNAISESEIEQVFHLDNGRANILTSPSAGSNREKVLAIYLLCGIGELLARDEPSFDDKTAREACQTAGCYDPTNHAKHLAAKGNWLDGSKDKGWKVTTPGLTQAADLIKRMSIS